jgi:hypothetical protein
MTGYTPTHVGIPKDHAEFERNSVILFRELLKDPSVKRLGRSGQSQYGIDLIGYRSGDLKKPVGIQCKKKRPGGLLKAEEVRREVRKALKYRPAISEYFIVTTAEDDAELDKLAQALSKAQREQGRKLRILIWGWGTLEEQIDQYPEAKEAFDPGASPAVKEVKAKLEQLTVTQSKQATSEQVAKLAVKIDRQIAAGDERLPPSYADKEIGVDLSRINRRAGFPEAKRLEELAELATRVMKGDLSRGSAILRANVLERVARSHLQSQAVELAKSFHLEALNLNQQLDTSFYDALLPAVGGDPDKSLRELRRLGTPEAKSAIFLQLFRTSGTKNALHWLETNGIGINDLDAGGTLRVAFLLLMSICYARQKRHAAKH